MTPIILLDELEKFVKNVTKDIKLQVKVDNQHPTEDKVRNIAVYKMQLPKKHDKLQKVPYIILQLIAGKDDKDGREPEESTCQIRIVIATYSEDGGVGATDVLNVIMRIRTELKKVGVLGKQFVLINPLEYIVYPNDTRPYFIGDMMTNWSIPTVKREVESIWQ